MLDGVALNTWNTQLLVLSIQYARVYLDGNLQMWVDAEDSLTL